MKYLRLALKFDLFVLFIFHQHPYLFLCIYHYLVAVPTGLVRVLNAKASSIVNVINAYKNKLEENS